MSVREDEHVSGSVQFEDINNDVRFKTQLLLDLYFFKLINLDQNTKNIQIFLFNNLQHIHTPTTTYERTNSKYISTKFALLFFNMYTSFF